MKVDDDNTILYATTHDIHVQPAYNLLKMLMSTCQFI